MKVIYIMGAGHIGSTILDLVISSHPQIESLGEVSKFHRFGWMPDDNRNCACGASVYNCKFWSQVRQKWMEIMDNSDASRYIYLQNRFEHSISGWIRLLWSSLVRTDEFREYAKGTESLYQAIQYVSGKTILVDSSLIPKRAYAQILNKNIDIYLIHLVRDGRGVIWSLMKPDKKILSKVYVPASPWRTIKYWISANLQSVWVSSQIGKNKQILVRYEDFVINPSEVLNRIGNLIGENMSDLILDSKLTHSNQDRHTVGGNRVRLQRNEDIRIRADFAWMDNLPDRVRQMYWFFAGWLARRYGYKQNETDYQA